MKKIKILLLVLLVLTVVGCSHEHKYSEEIVKPTCTEKGYTKYTCKCGDSYNDNEVDATGHSFSEWEVVKEATEEENGLKEKVCLVCSYKTQDVIAKLAHTHKYTDKVVEPTCTKEGYTEHTCECGYSYTDLRKDPSHKEEVILGKDATCTEDGLTDGKKCSVCNEILVEQEIIKAKGHEYGEWIISKEPTSTEVGFKERKCLNCDQGLEKIEIPMLPYSDGLVYKLNDNNDGYIVTSIGECKDINVNITPVYNNLPVTGIKNNAFEECNNIVSIIIPNSVNYIGMYAFLNCDALKEVTLSNQITTLPENIFMGCVSLESFEIPASITKIESGAFDGCTTLKEITIPNTVTEIESSLFTSCSSLTKVVLPEGIKIINDNMFFSCSNLTTVVIPNTVTTIGESAFAYCTSLKEITIPNGIQTIKFQAFSNCTSITTIELPNSVTNLAQSAFYNCTSLKEIKLSNLLTEIKDNTFYNCTSLVTIEIPRMVTKIDKLAFLDCTNLTNVIIPSNINNIDSYSFKGCKALKNIYYKGSKISSKEELLESSIPSSATIYYYSSTKPIDNDNYWYYNEQSEIVIWE